MLLLVILAVVDMYSRAPIAGHLLSVIFVMAKSGAAVAFSL